MTDVLAPFIGMIPVASASFLAFVLGTVVYDALSGPRTRIVLLLAACSLLCADLAKEPPRTPRGDGGTGVTRQPAQLRQSS